jgi:hypothetical protein
LTRGIDVERLKSVFDQDAGRIQGIALLVEPGFGLKR